MIGKWTGQVRQLSHKQPTYEIDVTKGVTAHMGLKTRRKVADTIGKPHRLEYTTHR